MNKKKGRSRFYSLPEKTAVNVQIETLKHDFEMAKNSVAARDIINHYNEVAAQHEEAEGIERIKPANMLVACESQQFSLPLIYWPAVEKLAHGGSYSNYKQLLQNYQLNILSNNLESADLEDLWSLVYPFKLAQRSTHESVEALLPAVDDTEDNPGIVDPDQAGAEVKQRKIDERIAAPATIRDEMIDFMSGYGIKNALADAMLDSLATQREYLYPRIEELKPGQVIWLARSSEYKPRWGESTADYLQPVVISLYTPEELGQPPTSKERLKKEEIERLARITSEAYLQDGVFTMIDLVMLLNRSSVYIKKLIDIYKETYQMWLPTAGTILDMGRCTTHKKEAVELNLKGYNTTSIARNLFHTEEAIDRYLSQFHKVSLLHLELEASKRTICYLLGTSKTLVDEYIDLVNKYREQILDDDIFTDKTISNNKSYGT